MEKTNGFNYLASGSKTGRKHLAVYLLVLCLGLGQPLLGADDHDDHDTPAGKPKKALPPKPQEKPRPDAAAAPSEEADGCGVSPQVIADFANGDNFNMK